MEDMNEFASKRREHMLSLKEDGWTLEQIGAYYGISHQRVSQVLERSYSVRERKEKIVRSRKNKMGANWTREAKNEYAKVAHQKNRNEAIEALGGRCVKCGMLDLRCLQIDHINGGGGKEIRSTGAYARYKWIKSNVEEAKLKYQILCANCNWIKRDENNELKY